MKLRSIISTVSAYLDQYVDTPLTKKEDASLNNVNTVILEALELLETNPSPKREGKMVSTLDKAFDECIEVFANRGTPEILETKIVQTKTSKTKKSKGEPMSKKKKPTSIKKKTKTSKKNQPMGFRPEFDPQKVIESISSKVDLSPSEKKRLGRMAQDVAEDLATANLPDPREFISLMSQVPTIISNNKSSSQLLALMTKEIDRLRTDVKELKKQVRKLSK